MSEYIISKKISAEFEVIKKKYLFLPTEPDPARPLAPNKIFNKLLLIKQFDNKQLSEIEKFQIQEYKLELMKSLYYSIQTTSNDFDTLTPVDPNSIHSKPPEKKYLAYLASGLTMNIIHGFISGRSLLQAIPGISNPLLLGLSGVLSILNGVTYYLFEGYVLKKNLGIPIIGRSAKEYFSLYEQQIAFTRKINLKLQNVVSTTGLTVTQYQSYARVATHFNQTVTENKEKFTAYQESQGIKVARYSLIGFGAVMAASGGFFMVKSLLTIASVALLGSPVGWGLLILGMALSVVIHMGLKPKKMFSMLNPSAQYFNALKDKYRTFKPLTDNDFNKVKCHKIYTDTVQRKPSVDLASTTITTTISFATTLKHNPRMFKAGNLSTKGQDASISQSTSRLLTRRASVP